MDDIANYKDVNIYDDILNNKDYNIYYDDFKKTPNNFITLKNSLKKSEYELLLKLRQNTFLSNNILVNIIFHTLMFSVLIAFNFVLFLNIETKVMPFFDFNTSIISSLLASFSIIFFTLYSFLKFKSITKNRVNPYQKIIKKSEERKNKIKNKFLKDNININNNNKIEYINKLIYLKFGNNLNILKNLNKLEQEEILKKIYINEFNILSENDIKEITHNNQIDNGSIKPPKKIIKIND